MQQVTGGNLIEGMQALTAIAPLIIIPLAVTYTRFHSQAPSRKWLRQNFPRNDRTIPENLRNTN